MNELDIALNNLTEDVRYGRRAILWRGGEISATAGFHEVVTKIPSLPASSSIGTVEDDSRSIYKDVPVDSIDYCYLKSIGGMTYKCENLMPFPYEGTHGEMQIGGSQSVGELTVTLNSDKSLRINKTAGPTDDTFRLYIRDLDTSDYYLTVLYNGANFFDVSSNVGIIPFNTSVFIPSTTGITYIDIHCAPESEGDGTISIILSKVPYFEGLIDTKTTAVKVHGANLIPFPYYSKSNTTNGITVTVSDDGSITFDGTATDKVQFVLSNNIPLIADEKYTVSASVVGTWVDGLSMATAVKYDANLPSLTTNIVSYRQSQELSKGYKVSDMRIIIQSGTVCNNLVFKPMLNIGAVVLPHKPYHEPTTYEIPESLQVSKGIEGAIDTVDFFNNKKDIKCKTVALGDENYTIQTPSGNVRGFFYVKNSSNFDDFNLELSTKALCSSLPTTEVYNGTVAGVCLEYKSSSDPYVSVTVPDFYLTNIDGSDNKAKFVNWLKQNNVTLTYALADPIVTPLPISTFNNLFSVEGGGYLEFVTDNGRAPNSNVRFQTIV